MKQNAYRRFRLAAIASLTLLWTSSCKHNPTLCVDPHLATCFDTIGHALFSAYDGDTILISADTYNENLYIKKNVSLVGTMEGPYPGIRTVIRGALSNAPVLHIMLDKTVHLSTMTVTGGNYSNGGGGILNIGVLYADNVIVEHNSTTARGGGILNVGYLSMTDSVVQYNTADEGSPQDYEGGYGGGIYNHQGAVALTRTDVIYNSSSSRGGGLYTNGKLTVTDGNISNNESGSSGGGIEINFWSAEEFAYWEFADNRSIPEVNLERVTVDGNHAGWGGGINNNNGILILTNVTLSSNEADISGGAIWTQRFLERDSSARVDIYASTIANNRVSANHGGGIATGETTRPITIGIFSSILADNPGGNCAILGSATLQSWDYNISDDGTCNFPYHADLINADPMLKPLALNAPGRVKTHALLVGSPADDHSIDGCNTPLDARGVMRGLPCDTGAYEGTEEPYHYTAKAAVNAACRAGPGTGYGVLAYLKAGETHAISGRNPDGTWLRLETCWVARSLLTTEADLQSLPVLEVPPLPTATPMPQTSCSNWTSPETCRAAGCTWKYASAGPGFCR